MSDAGSLTDDFAGHLPLTEAVRLATIVWGCEAPEAWARLRPFMISGVIKTKTSLPSFMPREIHPEEWHHPDDKTSHENGVYNSAAWGGTRWPVYVDEDALVRHLTNTQRNLHDADTAMLLRLYDQVNEPNSKVPVNPLIEALGATEGARFYRIYVEAIRAGLFDDTGLERLSRSEWAPLTSSQLREIELHYEVAAIRDFWILRTALPLQALMSWANKFDVPLPLRFRVGNDRHAEPPSDSQSDNLGQTVVAGAAKGRRKNVDAGFFWAEIERLVDDGVQADPRVAGHTVDKLTNAMVTWASRHMQKPYENSTIKRYIERRWAKLQERSRSRIK